MTEPSNRWKLGGGAVVLLLIAFPLLREFWEPAHMGWNVLLVAFLAGLLVAAYFLTRFFREHIGEIGEARFDTHNPDQPNG
jgi:membrane protein implicated in regulation of membrane protease activity